MPGKTAGPRTPRSWYKPAAPATVYKYGVAVKSFFNWAEQEEYIERSPGCGTKVFRIGKS